MAWPPTDHVTLGVSVSPTVPRSSVTERFIRVNVRVLSTSAAPLEPVAPETLGVAEPDGVLSAFAGTMTRLKIIVNASSDERNFFIIFFILSHFCDLAPRAQSLSHTSAFYHAAGNKGTGKCKIHKFFIFLSAASLSCHLLDAKSVDFVSQNLKFFKIFYAAKNRTYTYTPAAI